MTRLAASPGAIFAGSIEGTIFTSANPVLNMAQKSVTQERILNVMHNGFEFIDGFCLQLTVAFGRRLLLCEPAARFSGGLETTATVVPSTV